MLTHQIQFEQHPTRLVVKPTAAVKKFSFLYQVAETSINITCCDVRNPTTTQTN